MCIRVRARASAGERELLLNARGHAHLLPLLLLFTAAVVAAVAAADIYCAFIEIVEQVYAEG